MGIRFLCNHCEKRLNVKATQAGEFCICPDCENEILIPLESTIEPKKKRKKKKRRKRTVEVDVSPIAKDAVGVEFAASSVDAEVFAPHKEVVSAAVDSSIEAVSLDVSVDDVALEEISRIELPVEEVTPVDVATEEQLSAEEPSAEEPSAEEPSAEEPSADVQSEVDVEPTENAADIVDVAETKSAHVAPLEPMPSEPQETTAETTAEATAESPAEQELVLAPLQKPVSATNPPEPPQLEPAAESGSEEPVSESATFGDEEKIDSAAALDQLLNSSDELETETPSEETESFLLAKPVAKIEEHPLKGNPDLVWYLRHKRLGEKGPLKAREVETMLEAGQIRRGFIVWRADWNDWLPAEKIFPELAEKKAAKSTYQIPEDLNPHSEINRKRRAKKRFWLCFNAAAFLLLLVLVYWVTQFGS